MVKKLMKFFIYKLQYVLFWITAKNSKGHGTHSPFVYNFIIDVLNDTRNFYAFDEIKKVHSKRIKATKPSLKCYELLFRIINYYSCQSILYIGQKNELQKVYLYRANQQAKLSTINEIEKDLQTLVNKDEKFDVIYFSEDKWRNFNKHQIKHIVTSTHKNSIIIIENIYKNKNQKLLWQELCKTEGIYISVDVFHFGIIFLNEKLRQREDFKIRF
jgi:hypothetical protein